MACIAEAFERLRSCNDGNWAVCWEEILTSIPLIGRDRGLVTKSLPSRSFWRTSTDSLSRQITWAGQPHHGSHVRPIQVYLASILMDNVANVTDGAFENAVGGRFGNHERRQIFLVPGGFLPQLNQVDIPIFIR